MDLEVAELNGLSISWAIAIADAARAESASSGDSFLIRARSRLTARSTPLPDSGVPLLADLPLFATAAGRPVAPLVFRAFVARTVEVVVPEVPGFAFLDRVTTPGTGHLSSVDLTNPLLP